MIHPTKHIPAEQTPLGAGAVILSELSRKRTVTGLREAVREAKVAFPALRPRPALAGLVARVGLEERSKPGVRRRMVVLPGSGFEIAVRSCQGIGRLPDGMWPRRPPPDRLAESETGARDWGLAPGIRPVRAMCALGAGIGNSCLLGRSAAAVGHWTTVGGRASLRLQRGAPRGGVDCWGLIPRPSETTGMSSAAVSFARALAMRVA